MLHMDKCVCPFLNMCPCPAGGQALMGHGDRLPTETDGGKLIGSGKSEYEVSTIWQDIPNPCYMRACPARGRLSWARWADYRQKQKEAVS